MKICWKHWSPYAYIPCMQGKYAHADQCFQCLRIMLKSSLQEWSANDPEKCGSSQSSSDVACWTLLEVVYWIGIDKKSGTLLMCNSYGNLHYYLPAPDGSPEALIFILREPAAWRWTKINDVHWSRSMVLPLHDFAIGNIWNYHYRPWFILLDVPLALKVWVVNGVVLVVGVKCF